MRKSKVLGGLQIITEIRVFAAEKFRRKFETVREKRTARGVQERVPGIARKRQRQGGDRYYFFRYIRRSGIGDKTTLPFEAVAIGQQPFRAKLHVLLDADTGR